MYALIALVVSFGLRSGLSVQPVSRKVDFSLSSFQNRSRSDHGAADHSAVNIVYIANDLLLFLLVEMRDASLQSEITVIRRLKMLPCKAYGHKRLFLARYTT
jgi:hypothetical protein